MKELLKRLEAAEELTDRLDAQLEKEPENEELDAAWDKAYNDEWDAREAVVNEIVSMTNGQIEPKTARLMLTTKRAELMAIVERMA